ncbi:ABC transporter ATP-binding protein [Parapusillimonas granuli]|uniref:ABC transporter ATP-binding protein n=1 Tax=Parapusillimonas granuli TaxID=380911 RepID=A0A853G3C4_9BURK|nr:ABC transporter ATP-binding protein [Parapusillimonas granuli]MBB5215965.1 peptide/nickel transport system ATP-binding protein [Parapusillimonas granuli]MEB2399352.1 ABC transporter ATP-binding protein [Alcaligenaceae bacterium]NYT50737.1 ABC transporter ATP-binding protein [Parapusillimonas granuli]
MSAVLSVKGLAVELATRRATAYILNDISFDVGPGETVCLVGESGCGKSMTALAIMRLIPEPGRISAGSVSLRGTDLVQADVSQMRRIRGNKISMIFQEPMTALNPVYTVGDQICEPLRLHQGLGREEARQKALEILQSVGIPAPDRRIDNYPHEMSGGMRQRVMIAMALACDPDVLIADEPTTALDVTVQAQIFDLLREQQQRRGTAIIMITHDMGAVAEMSDRVVVMYGGRVVEEGMTAEILAAPRHPYTQGLIACLPELDPAPSDHRPDLPEIPGIVPSIWNRGAGCPFADRCAHVMAQCRKAFPPSFQMGPTQKVACWLYEDQS